ncbi:hypothetical protein IFM89_038608 [Coptis chinensis]|uniref:Pentatricopeptide repeat-containing protein n=1 Tax=Coptis chinensis TaxID=261450 RepID=A0A835HZ31_9MAGN|nr:hypothetical protein IFM89_038608 [Coptis chinensis]
MISGYAQNGQGTKAVQIFESMLKSSLAPDHISYVAVLSGCSHSGLVMEGKQDFDSMTKDQEDAKKMIDEMPMEACASAWGALAHVVPMNGGKLVLVANESLPRISGTRLIMDLVLHLLDLDMALLVLTVLLSFLLTV